MVEQQASFFSSDTGYRAFTALKWVVYGLLCLNAYLFLDEELAALEHTFVDGFEPGQIIQVFSATIDTCAWIVLLLLFELETSVLDDSRIQGGVRWALHGIRYVCSAAIVYAFTGYLAELLMLYSTQPFAGDACAMLGQGISVLVDLDDYVPLAADNCATLAAPVSQLQGFDILVPAPALDSARYLAWTDVINSGTWILVVVVLEVEVRLQLRGRLSPGIMDATKYLKFVLYAILFVCAVYWGFEGDFVDFWDAFLWLFAFIFIELNVFEWNVETSQQAVGDND